MVHLVNSIVNVRRFLFGLLSHTACCTQTVLSCAMKYPFRPIVELSKNDIVELSENDIEDCTSAKSTCMPYQSRPLKPVVRAPFITMTVWVWWFVRDWSRWATKSIPPQLWFSKWMSTVEVRKYYYFSNCIPASVLS